METITLPHLSESPLLIGLFTNVTNAAFLRQQLLQGNSDFEYAFLDAEAILSRNHVLAACFRAVVDSQSDRMKSRNVHSEIVFSLSPNNNIADSFRRFGLSESTTAIVAVKVQGNESHADFLQRNIQGEPVPFVDDNLARIQDVVRITKIYKLDHTAHAAMETCILASMALKGS